MATLNDLITSSALISATDPLGGMYDRLFALLGATTEPYSTTVRAGTGMTVSTPAAGSVLNLVAVTAAWPDTGVITIENEKILYQAKSVTANTVTVDQRGYLNTAPALHVDGATVYAPSSISRLARRILQVITGDGSIGAIAGVGDLAINVINRLASGFAGLEVASENAPGGLLATLTSGYFSLLNSDIAAYGGTGAGALVGTPSFGALSVSNLLDYLRWLNDVTTGTAFSCLMCNQVDYLYWLSTNGTPLDGKTVFPPVTTLSTCANGVWTIGTLLNRYSVTGAVNYTPGYAGQAIRARCTVLSNAANTQATLIQFNAQGMSPNGNYYGRPLAAIVTIGTNPATLANTPVDGDTLTVNNTVAGVVTSIVFTFRNAPAISTDVGIGATNTATALNLQTVLLTFATDSRLANVTTSLITSNVTFSSTGGTVNYCLLTKDGSGNPNSTRMSLFAGTTSLQSSVTFGGGAGPNIDGTGADSAQPLGVSGDDDFVSFNFPSSVNITGATNATPIVIATGTPHGLLSDQTVSVASVTGNTAANGTWQIKVVDSTHVSLNGSTGNGAWVSGGTIVSVVDLSSGATVGSWAPIVGTGGKTRALQILDGTQLITKSGAGTGYTIQIETIQDRIIN